ncbi:THAP domain-containing protein 3 [Holothuria leucospilota]|uniref:THAP domain-containing protein 3 n=1 Tax=Holothuria leucospilota TaxID=206669 RepID=A0A9Q1BBZ7_HOLLE|nr:THAP domain-containing protein 3 [Holothuria leucospilota]KAJ8041159.1 THAP domain-containing protein 3 [Holothuria leucospilota]
MGRKCAIKSCQSRRSSDRAVSGEITFHRFPKAKTEEWMKATGLLGEELSPETTLCSEHFEKDCFAIIRTGRRCLLKNSIRTKNLGQVQYYRVPSLEKHNYYKGCKMEPFVPHSLCGRIFVGTVHSVC